MKKKEMLAALQNHPNAAHLHLMTKKQLLDIINTSKLSNEIQQTNTNTLPMNQILSKLKNIIEGDIINNKNDKNIKN